jgi:hypothetical protein
LPKRQELKQCFVIAPIGDPRSDIRKRSDQLIKHVLKPALGDRYEIQRADQLSQPGIITTQVIEHVINDDLVVADLTGHNPNVFYELAIRHALRKPLLQLIATGEPIPFDVAVMRTVDLDLRDLDSVEEAKREIVKQARVLETGEAEIDTPISFALSTEELKGSGNLVEASLRGILDAITELREELRQAGTPRYFNPLTGTTYQGGLGTSYIGSDFPVPSYTVGRQSPYLSDEDLQKLAESNRMQMDAWRESERQEKLRLDAELDAAGEAEAEMGEELGQDVSLEDEEGRD